MNHESLSLSELNSRIKENIQSGFPQRLWVVAEISGMNVNSSGHCYLELIEKDQLSDRLIAKIRATIWAYSFRMLKPYFEKATGYALSSGLKVMLNVSVEFHELYGLSLNIKDIDPAYTLGDLARKKQEIINRLTSEGVFDMNRELTFPVVPQRIAVISSRTAAGFGDFMHTLENNNGGFRFNICFYPAIMQGDQAGESIINAFEKIHTEIEKFDVVVLIRGGGSQADLECFNSYELAYFITQFPLPVITGIGHERDVSIADMVAHTQLKTPTAVAAYLVEKLTDFLETILIYEDAFRNNTLRLIREERLKIISFGKILSLMSRSRISGESKFLETAASQGQLMSRRFLLKHAEKLLQDKKFIKLHSRNILTNLNKEAALFKKDLQESIIRFFRNRKEKIISLEKAGELLDPRQIMKRGFSISTIDGKAVKDTSGIKEGDLIRTVFYKGNTESKIIKINNQTNDEQ